MNTPEKAYTAKCGAFIWYFHIFINKQSIPQPTWKCCMCSDEYIWCHQLRICTMFFISALCLVMEKSWFEFPMIIEFVMCLRVDQQQVEKVQRRAMKLIPDLHHLPYQWQLQELKTPSLYYRCRRGDMIAIYQLLQGKLDLDPHIFDTAVVCNNRGHQWKAKSHHTHNTFSVMVINDWNSPPPAVVSADTHNQFKNCLDSHWAHITHTIPHADD